MDEYSAGSESRGTGGKLTDGMMQLITRRALDMHCDMPTAAQTPMPELMYWQAVYEAQAAEEIGMYEPKQPEPKQQTPEQMWCVLNKAFGYDLRKDAKREKSDG